MVIKKIFIRQTFAFTEKVFFDFLNEVLLNIGKIVILREFRIELFVHHLCTLLFGKIKTTIIAGDGFDPSTSGLWAQHAPAAPPCYLLKKVKCTKCAY